MMHGRVLVDLHNRVLGHVERTAPHSLDAFRRASLSRPATLGVWHCCSLILDADDTWRIQKLCQNKLCPIGDLLTWTTAGRLAPGLASFRGQSSNLYRLRWPVRPSNERAQWCVVCGTWCEWPKGDRAIGEFGAIDGRNQCLCGGPNCYSALMGFIHGAFTWWALGADGGRSASLASRLPVDIIGVIGSFLATLVVPSKLMG